MDREKVMVSELELRKWTGLAVSSPAAAGRERLWGCINADFIKG